MSIKSRSGGSRPLVSIIIPVKNGMPEFARVLAAVARQEFEHHFEVIIIDSGSGDGSLEAAQRLDEHFTVIEIDPSEFGHGKTRNHGISLATGEFCAFLTHDAMPADNHWLSELIQPLIDDDEIAGVFGRHIAYQNASPFTKYELDDHFDGLSAWPVVQICDAVRYTEDEELRKIYHFYSDNNSCLRRSVWQKFPYPEVDFAEDQAWAKLIVEAGYKKAYADGAVVYHSHDYSSWQRMQRAYDEARALNELFGYEFSRSLWHSLQNYIHLIWRDARIAFKNGWYFKHPLWVASRPAQLFALVTGHYLGTRNFAYLNRSETIISRDRKLKIARKEANKDKN